MAYQEKVAVVTGAAGSGMGRSLALTLGREGAHVVVNYRMSKESAEAVVDLLRSRGGSAIAVQALYISYSLGTINKAVRRIA